VLKPTLNLNYMKQCILALICVLAFSCSPTYQISTLNHEPEIRIIDNEFQLNRLLRKDFKFRWDFAQYAMSQPYGWYMSNYSFNRWRPYNAFDIYWNSTQYWTDWAFNYPFQSSYYGWNRPFNWGYSQYSWYNGPWDNQGYNAIWNRSQRYTTAYINGRRGSTMSIQDRIGQSSMIESTKPRVNVKETKLERIVTNLRVKIDNKNIRVYNNPNNPNINNNNNISKPRVYVRPNTNPRPVYNNTSVIRSSKPPTIKRGGN